MTFRCRPDNIFKLENNIGNIFYFEKGLNPGVILKVGWVWVRVNVVLNRTVVVDSDCRFNNLCGSHLQSQSELYHVSWWYYTLMVLCQLMVLYFFILLLLRYRNVEQNVFLHYFQNKSLDCIWAFMRPQNRVVVEHFLYLCPLLGLSICTKYAEKNLKLKKKNCLQHGSGIYLLRRKKTFLLL